MIILHILYVTTTTTRFSIEPRARQRATVWHCWASLVLRVYVLHLASLSLTYQCYTPLFFDSAKSSTHTELHGTTGSRAQVKQSRWVWQENAGGCLQDVRLRWALKPCLGIPLHTETQYDPGKAVIYSTQHWLGSMMYCTLADLFLDIQWKRMIVNCLINTCKVLLYRVRPESAGCKLISWRNNETLW